jgi:hypothetical protein
LLTAELDFTSKLLAHNVRFAGAENEEDKTTNDEEEWDNDECSDSAAAEFATRARTTA